MTWSLSIVYHLWPRISNFVFKLSYGFARVKKRLRDYEKNAGALISHWLPTLILSSFRSSQETKLWLIATSVLVFSQGEGSEGLSPSMTQEKYHFPPFMSESVDACACSYVHAPMHISYTHAPTHIPHVLVPVNMPVCTHPCEYPPMHNFLWICPYAHVSVNMSLCTCPYAHVSVNMSLWTCPYAHVSVNISLCMCPSKQEAVSSLLIFHFISYFTLYNGQIFLSLTSIGLSCHSAWGQGK